MNRKISLGAALAFALIVATAVFSLTMAFANNRTNQALEALEARQGLYRSISQLDEKLRDRYYGTIDEEQLRNAVARGFVEGIGDPNAQYYSAEEYAARSVETSGMAAGIGVRVQISPEGYLEVLQVYPDSPADVAGIKEGTLIIEIDGDVITGEKAKAMARRLQGPDKSKISLVVRSNDSEEYYDLNRRIIVEPTVIWKIMPDTHVGYIRIVEFDKNTANQFSRALQEIQQQGGDSLIFDLRGNQSKELGSSPRILNRLVPAGDMISVVYKDGTTKNLEYSDNNELAWPMAVLVDNQTAGAAEIFAQVLMDYNKAKSVGTITAGKGIQLETVRFSDGSAAEITVALYQSPEGKTFDGEGLRPDYEVGLSLPPNTTLQTIALQEDTQLQKAIELVTAV